MPEINREKDQIWITRNHLLALGVGTTCVAILTFFLGLKLGRSGVGEEEASRPPPLTVDPAGQEELEAVLRQAARAQPPKDFSFPSELPADSVTPPGPEVVDPSASAASVAAPSSGQTVQVADGPVGDVPHGGWSVQIGIYATPADADARMKELSERSLKPYRVAALVDGQSSWRVRVGGYGTQKAAEEAIPGLREKLGVGELTAVPAP